MQAWLRLGDCKPERHKQRRCPRKPGRILKKITPREKLPKKTSKTETQQLSFKQRGSWQRAPTRRWEQYLSATGSAAKQPHHGRENLPKARHGKTESYTATSNRKTLQRKMMFNVKYINASVPPSGYPSPLKRPPC